MNKIRIIALYKHNVVYRNVKKRNISTLIFSFSLVLILFCLLSGFKNSTVFSQCITALNPINELYRDVQVATFVYSENTNFIVPVKSINVENSDSSIVFTVGESIMIIAPASGEIIDIGKGENKYIKIKHSDSLYSIISGIEISGVKEKQFVKQGKEIATAKPNSKVKLELIKDGKKIQGLYIYKSFVKWD